MADPSTHPVVKTVADTLAAHNMTAPGDRVLIGFSGGPDSTALARALMILAPRLDLSVGLAHLNHCLRGEDADRDEVFAREFARTFQLDLHVDRCHVRTLAQKEKRSVEDAGRQARYSFFNTLSRRHGYTCTATGHHRDDHTEQVLLNLIRGTGPGGLKGISPVREKRIIRPLIRLRKSEILEFLSDLNQSFVMDASNQDTGFLRNRVRHRLIPLMEEEFNPEIRAGLDRLSQLATLEDGYMEMRADELYASALCSRKPDEITLVTAPLNQSHPAIFGRVIRKAIRQVKKDLKRITHTHVLDIRNLVRDSQTGKHLDLPGQIRVYRRKKEICFKREALPLRQLGKKEKGPDTGH